MANRSKIVDLREVLEWIESGKTYAWIRDEYLRKYDVETSMSMWRNVRQQHGIARRIERDDDLIPWEIRPEHRHRHAVSMLRMENRLRRGLPVSPTRQRMHSPWKAKLLREGLVVHYDPESEKGFSYVPKRPEVDLDLIREPDSKTTRRRRDDGQP